VVTLAENVGDRARRAIDSSNHALEPFFSWCSCREVAQHEDVWVGSVTYSTDFLEANRAPTIARTPPPTKGRESFSRSSNMAKSIVATGWK
jgi:hypothetical protein